MTNPIGQQLGNYRLLRLLGEGGYADVYLGEHIYLKTLAAVKVLKVRLAGDSVESFLKEARTLVRLDHPHIIRVLECGIEENVPFLVMSYASDGTIRQRHPRGSLLPIATIISYVRQMAAAVQYAHEANLIHRDIKPENMLIDHSSHLLLSDFGLAVVSQSATSNDAYARAGTMAYMAPEQFQGMPRRASDQYALGIVVYEWLTGAVPFRGTGREIAMQHLHRLPPPLRDQLPHLAPSIERVILKALAKEPEERFARTVDFAVALEEAWLTATPHSLSALPIDPLVFTLGTGQNTGISTPPHSGNYEISTIASSNKEKTALMDAQSAASSPLAFLSPAQATTPRLTGSALSGPVETIQAFNKYISRRMAVAGLAGIFTGGLLTLAAEKVWHTLIPQAAAAPVQFSIQIVSLPAQALQNTVVPIIASAHAANVTVTFQAIQGSKIFTLGQQLTNAAGNATFQFRTPLLPKLRQLLVLTFFATGIDQHGRQAVSLPQILEIHK